MYLSEFISLLTEAFARLLDLISVNQSLIAETGVIKRRRWGRSWIIYAGNVFLKYSNSRIVMFPDPAQWQAWECYCYQLLHESDCKSTEKNALLIERLPGESLRSLLESDLLTSSILIAAASELRRVHKLQWSHGDPHLDNILYDGARAYLIDFETQHLASLLPEERYTDDLLVVMLDLIGRVKSEQWQEWSRVFLEGYGDPFVLLALNERLKVPKGLELVLWKSRTHYLPEDVLKKRLTTLKEIIHHLI